MDMDYVVEHRCCLSPPVNGEPSENHDMYLCSKHGSIEVEVVDGMCRLNPQSRGTTSRHTPQLPPSLNFEVVKVLQRIFSTGILDKTDLRRDALYLLSRTRPEVAIDALNDVKAQNFRHVRNKSTFVMSRIRHKIGKWYFSETVPGYQVSDDVVSTDELENAMAHLPNSIRKALMKIFYNGICNPFDFDDRAMDVLQRLPEQTALRALIEFKFMTPWKIKNASALWMRVAQKNAKQDRINASKPADPVKQAIREMVHRGELPQNPFDHYATMALCKLPIQGALRILSNVRAPRKIRNLSAYVTKSCLSFVSLENGSLESSGGFDKSSY